MPVYPKFIHRLTWLARSLSIAFALFTSMFALDVFTKSTSWGTIIIDLCMHLTPTLLVVFLFFIAWHWERIGGILYCLLGILYIFISIQSQLPWMSWLIIAIPLLLNGTLYIFISFRKQYELEKE